MATYTYICNSCDGYIFEVNIPIKDYDEHSKSVRCPKCSSSDIKKKFLAAPIIFKGNGFYATDKDK